MVDESERKSQNRRKLGNIEKSLKDMIEKEISVLDEMTAEHRLEHATQEAKIKALEKALAEVVKKPEASESD